MFYGNEFWFDGRSCREFGLKLYDFGNTGQQQNAKLTSSGEMLSDHVPGHLTTYFYGVDQNKPLEFDLVATADEDIANSGRWFERWEVSEISSWLCGHHTWKWLSVLQDDLITIRFKCRITDFTVLTHGSMPWAFSFHVTCDSPYAYTEPDVKFFDAVGEDSGEEDVSYTFELGYHYWDLTGDEAVLKSTSTTVALAVQPIQVMPGEKYRLEVTEHKSAVTGPYAVVDSEYTILIDKRGDGSGQRYEGTITIPENGAYLLITSRTKSVVVKKLASSTSHTVYYDNRSASHDYYYPIILILRGNSNTDCKIKNVSDHNREMVFSGLDSRTTKIRVDCNNQIITDESEVASDNLYASFNHMFLRLVPGANQLVLTGDFKMAIISSFPIDVGA